MRFQGLCIGVDQQFFCDTMLALRNIAEDVHIGQQLTEEEVFEEVKKEMKKINKVLNGLIRFIVLLPSGL